MRRACCVSRQRALRSDRLQDLYVCQLLQECRHLCLRLPAGSERTALVCCVEQLIRLAQERDANVCGYR